MTANREDPAILAGGASQDPAAPAGAAMDTDELEARLRAYAEGTLNPRPEAMAAIRVRLMAQARRRGAAPQPEGVWARLRRLADALGQGGMAPLRRPALAAALAVAILLGGAGAVAAGSGPGGPFYGLRLWLEEATLPSEANARAQAELKLLAERIDEAQDAARSGNEAGVAAALNAYRQILDQALAGAGTNLDQEERLRDALTTHIVVLEALMNQVPHPARDAIQLALDRSDRALDEIGTHGPGTPPGHGGTLPGTPPSSAGPPSPRPTPPGVGGGHGGAPSPRPGTTPAPEEGPAGTPSPIPSPLPGNRHAPPSPLPNR